jgi:hypothetical protein
MLNEVLKLTQGDLTMFTDKPYCNGGAIPFDTHNPPLRFDHIMPYSPTGGNGFNPNLPTPQALSKLGKAITPKCKHGVWLDSECDECKNEFFKNNGEKNV